MSEFIDLGAWIKSQIAQYERCLEQARKTKHFPTPDGVRPTSNVAIIERILRDIREIPSLATHN
jgi:hypothetical protein